MKNLKKKSLNAFLWDLGGTFGRKGISFITSIFLARLLTPEEFGIVGMALVFIAVFQVFGDVGFTKGLIQSQENTSVTYSSIFYINILLGSILTISIYLAAPIVGSFYENDQVTEVLEYLSLLFILSAFNIVQQTILQKQLKMKVLSLRTILAQVIGGAVGITMAFMGYGVFSLVAQMITAGLVTSIVLWTVTDWYPKIEFSIKEVKRLFGFSAYIFFEQILSKIFKEINTLFIGKAFSASTLGFFTRAESFNKLIIKFSSTSLSKVFFPVLSELQNDEKNYKRVYYKLISVVTLISFGFTGVLFILSETLIIGLFGAKWEPSVLIFQILVLKGYIYPVSVVINNAFLSQGKSKEFFLVGLVRKFSRLLPLVVGYFYGFNAFLIAFVILSNLLMVYNVFVAKIYANVSFWKHYKWIIEGFITVGIFLIPYYFFFYQNLYINILWAVIFGMYYIGISYLRKHDGLLFIKSNLSRFLKTKKLKSL